MNLFIITWKYICYKPLNTLLNIILLALGVAIMIVLLVLGKQLQEKTVSNARGIDLVVGAKGSPLQLIFSSVFHIDFPTGNITLAEAKKITKNRFVQSAIPLALGDNYKEFRIVGTNHAYPALYQTQIQTGKLWQQPYEVVLGSQVARQLALKVGDTFYGGHGIVASDHTHEDDPYRVSGILQKNNTVIDNLILTSIESVWKMHETPHIVETQEKEHDTDANDDTQHTASLHAVADTVTQTGITTTGLPEGENKEITSLLIKYRFPMAITQFPRYVNSQSSLQAASPAFETARLFSLLGVGVQVLEGFAYLIIFIACLSIFIALYNSLKERKYDLAVMRTLGTSPFRLFTHIMLEGIIITLAGGLLGFILGHGIIQLITLLYAKTSEVGITGFVFIAEEIWILLICLSLGIAASFLPALTAYKTNISKVLAGG